MTYMTSFTIAGTWHVYWHIYNSKHNMYMALYVKAYLTCIMLYLQYSTRHVWPYLQYCAHDMSKGIFMTAYMTYKGFLISNFRRVLYVVCFLLGNSPASEFRCWGITQKKTYNVRAYLQLCAHDMSGTYLGEHNYI